jgi:branched-subunit amino acid aminotransferase/4-amino-4-deoxychorismate lyase
MGVFTTLRVVRGEALFWPAHLARLRAAADVDAEGLLGEVAAAVGSLEDARVRITVAPPGPPLVEARPYAPPERPWRLRPVTVSAPGDAPLRKTTERGQYETARERAGDADDALLVAPDGALLETTVANLFLLLPGGQLATPPEGGILPGIARALALEAARDLKLAPRVARLDAPEAARALACVVTNALFVAHAVAGVEGIEDFRSTGLARDLREAIARRGPRIRIIER